MGAERAVTRWYAQRQMILNEIAMHQDRLEQLSCGNQHAAERAEAERQLAAARTRLLALGSCPRPMMG